ncbi:hypothetical protein MD588_23400 [Photobacterium sp. SDRW27]|uniref:hypothetical protein n=1 Tax=Photobacterium obscurum TaxID=2829490 RepID=UPI002243D3FB|nr:hypothetical protein [Photobacterium obscurum]MCW8331751.1 hypothetical protein [Photobacterium obscurum]
MRKLKIEIFESGNPESTIQIPVALAKILIKFLPKKLSSRLQENHDQLDALFSAIDVADTDGFLMEIDDHKSNEKVIFSIV